MKTWKNKHTVCRSRRTGRFVRKGKCKAFRRQRIRFHASSLFKL